MVKIAVVADSRRGDMGANLASKVNADHLSIDDGTLGCSGNHLAAWRFLAESLVPADTHAVVLEDDAVPVDDFREQLASALAVAPAPIVSFYLGNGYSSDLLTKSVLSKADAVGAQWIVTHGRVLHAVALAVRRELLPLMIEGVGLSRGIDGELSRWARRNGHSVAYSNPSLVDHCDEPSLVSRHRRAPRRAWRVGRNDAWDELSYPWH